MSVESLQSRGEDGCGGGLAVPAVHVALDGVNAGAACSLPVIRVIITHALLPLLSLLQRLAQQTCLVSIGVLILHAAALHLLQPGTERSGPGVTIVSAGHSVSTGVATWETVRGAGAGPLSYG